VRRASERLRTAPVALTVLAMLFGAVSVAPGQALHVASLINGTELLFVALPLSEATAVAWYVEVDGTVDLHSLISGSLTLSADVEEALAQGDASAAVTPVVVVIGGGSAEEITALLSRVLGRAPCFSIPEPSDRPLVEGGIDRRLALPGAEAELRLVLSLPPMADRRRTSIEVLLEILPELLRGQVSGLLVQSEDETAELRVLVDAELAEYELRRLRLSLARLAAEPQLAEGVVVGGQRRLSVRRVALLESEEEGARALAGMWRRGGTAAAREYLFGLAGVGLDSVREAAREWLPQHPGQAVLYLPPRVFNPRFASSPTTETLDNDLAATLLERPSTPMASLCLRPVLVPDLGGELSATVLARLAAAVRQEEGAPGWIRVRPTPPALELAAPPDFFAELCEALQRSLQRVAADEQPITSSDATARGRALQLMATMIGLDEGVPATPAELLRPGNLALGAVTVDSEAAGEALRKFGVGGERRSEQPRARPLQSGQKTREAAPGDQSALIVHLPIAAAAGAPVSVDVVGELLRERAAEILPQVRAAVTRPLVPGRVCLLLTFEASGELQALEKSVAQSWSRLLNAVSEDELAPVRRRVAAATIGERSGVLGGACLCAGIAAGETVWRGGAEVELEILMTPVDRVNGVLQSLPPWESLLTSGAGVLPLPAE
jgi:hypothetical protein